MFYGPNVVDQYRHAAGYVDRMLKGEKPADLPVQASTEYELVINLKTAKSLGFDVHLGQCLLRQLQYAMSVRAHSGFWQRAT
jgi:ABC-type uncharacterized transport system substrate-binding protein